MMNTMKHRVILVMLVTMAAILGGCSSIMRPPPAAAYMASYKQDKAVRNISYSQYFGNLDNGYHESTELGHWSHAEWWGDLTLLSYINGGYFTFGWGVQSLTPFLQGGFVSPYFGLTGWSNIFGLAVVSTDEPEDDESSFASYSGGGMLIEQIPLNDRWKIGITEHLSRNGREYFYVDDEPCEGVCFGKGVPSPRSKFYTEVGGGFYVSHSFKRMGNLALEFRYGRDWTENRNRFAVTLDFWGLSSVMSIGGNDIMRGAADNNIEKMKKVKTVSVDSMKTKPADTVETKNENIDSLHTIKRNWFRLADSSQTMSIIYHPTESVVAVTSKGICYDESANAVWLRQDYGKLIYQVPVDSLDYCQQMEPKSIFWTSVLEGSLGFLGGMLTTGSVPVSLAIGAGFGTTVWVVFKYGFDPEELAPKVYPEICSEQHSREDIIKWLKQYPCGLE